MWKGPILILKIFGLSFERKLLNICNFSRIAARNQISFWEFNLDFLLFQEESPVCSGEWTKLYCSGRGFVVSNGARKYCGLVGSRCFQERQNCWAFNEWYKWKVCKSCLFCLRTVTVNAAEVKITGKTINQSKMMGPINLNLNLSSNYTKVMFKIYKAHWIKSYQFIYLK